MSPQIQMFAQNIFLLIGLLFCAACGLILLLAAWIGAKVLIWQLRRLAHERAARRVVYDEDGVPIPPTFRGACTLCGVIFDRVYQVADERHLCPRCYRLNKRTAAAAAPPAEPDSSRAE